MVWGVGVAFLCSCGSFRFRNGFFFCFFSLSIRFYFIRSSIKSYVCVRCFRVFGLCGGFFVFLGNLVLKGVYLMFL